MRRGLLLALLGVFAIAMGVRIVMQSLAEPDGWTTVAAAALATGDLPRAESVARAALAANPLDGRAYRVLAQVGQRRGDSALAERFTSLAVSYAPRDLEARALAAQQAIERGDFADAVRHYDRMLRVEPGTADKVFPVLTGLAQLDAGRDELVTRLALQPDWRGGLLQYFGSHAGRAADLPPLFHALAQRGPLAPSEMSNYLSRFVTDRLWEEGYLAWLNELSPQRRSALTSPVNGNFESAESGGSPFEWQMVSGDGVEAGVVPRSNTAGHALRVAFAGQRNTSGGARQLLLLQAGQAYELHWLARLDGLDTPRGLQWRIRCAGGDETVLATEPVRGTTDWRPRQAAFSLPADCRAQWLELTLDARIAAESVATGAAWIDDVDILSVGVASR